jgi:hypothetical protein
LEHDISNPSTESCYGLFSQHLRDISAALSRGCHKAGFDGPVFDRMGRSRGHISRWFDSRRADYVNRRQKGRLIVLPKTPELLFRLNDRRVSGATKRKPPVARGLEGLPTAGDNPAEGTVIVSCVFLVTFNPGVVRLVGGVG